MNRHTRKRAVEPLGIKLTIVHSIITIQNILTHLPPQTVYGPHWWLEFLYYFSTADLMIKAKRKLSDGSQETLILVLVLLCIFFTWALKKSVNVAVPQFPFRYNWDITLEALRGLIQLIFVKCFEAVRWKVLLKCKVLNTEVNIYVVKMLYSSFHCCLLQDDSLAFN